MNIIIDYLQEHSMPSEQKYADRLREEAYKTLRPQIQALEEELQDFSKLFSNKILDIGFKLEALRHADLPAAESALNEYLREDLRKRDIEGEQLAHFTHGLRTKETQEEILTSLLDSALNCFPLVALFVVHGDMLKGWASRGFSDSTTEAVSLDEFRRSDHPGLLEALRNESWTESADIPDIGSLHHMREEASGFWQLYPLRVLGRPVAIMFAGGAEGFVGRPKALSILMDFAALRLENVALKIISTLDEVESDKSDDEVSFEVEHSFEVHPAYHPPVETSSVVLNLNPTYPIEMPAPTESVGESYYEYDAFQLDSPVNLKPYEPLPEPVVVFPEVDAEEPEQVTIVEIMPGEAEPDVNALLQYAPNLENEELDMTAEQFTELLASEITQDDEITEVEITSKSKRETIVETSYAAAKPAQVMSAPEAYTPMQYTPSTETEILNTAARRFAELLVYEIRHDNEDAIAEGRKKRDLYRRLKKDMDRSREIYEKRVAPTVASSVDYLHEVFVHILGGDDAGTLGEDYPGPSFRDLSRTVTP